MGSAFVVRGATVIDGTGGARYRADVAVRDDRIVAVGTPGEMNGAREVDARGLVIAPGFIDVHTHDDRALLSTPDMTPKVSQGVTTVVTGNCGVSIAPLSGCDPPPPLNLLGGRDWYRFASVGEYREALEADPAALNSLMLVGHTTLRVGAMGGELARPATEAEIGVMGERLDAALEAGCAGLSTGLAYPPAAHAPTEEVLALARRLPRYGALYATHMRDEGEGLLESVRETLHIGREAEVPVVISHHKAVGRANFGKTRATLEMIADARRRQPVDFDVYPYAASSTVLLGAFVERAERVTITWSEPHPELAGRDLGDIVAEWGTGRDEVIDRLQPAGAIYHQMDEDEVRRVLAFPGAMVGSDGLPHDPVPHPRLWGTFPRVLGHYARDEGLFTLEEAVHRMTGKTARTLGLPDRGVLREGAVADLVLFDPDTVVDRAAFDRPTRTATGIERVWVSGTLIWDGAESTGARPGRVLRRCSPPDRAGAVPGPPPGRRVTRRRRRSP